MSRVTLISLLLIVMPEYLTGITVLQVGSYVLSQKALTDAPERYTSYVLEAIKRANESPMNDITEEHGCSTSYWVWLSRASKTFVIVPGTLSAVIVSDGIQVQAKINAVIKTPVNIEAKTRFLFWCFKKTVCDNLATLTGQFGLAIKITAVWSGKVVITASPTLTSDNFQINGCHPPWWIRIIVDVNAKIHAIVEQQLYDAISRMEQKINIPSSFSPYGGIYFTYQVTSVKFFANERILLTANCSVQADKKNSDGTTTRLTFDTPNVDAANMLPPTDWDLGLINGSLYQLQGVRLSSTILEAFFWGAQTIGAFNASATSPFLDSEITVDSQFTPPISGVNLQNQLTVLISSGRVYATCKSSNGNSLMLDTAFTSLSGNATIHATPNKIGVIIEVLQFDVSGHNVEIIWPPLPMSPEFVEAIERVAMSNVVPKMNKYFRENPLNLPPDIAALIPNPRLLLFHQSGCCGGTHGFLDFASYCSTMKDESQWIKCQFATQNDLSVNRPMPLNVAQSTNEINALVRPVQGAPDIIGLFMLQYSSTNCSLLCGSETNFASLSFIAIVNENCTHQISPSYDLHLAIKTTTGILVGLSCNDSCSINSCLYKIESVTVNTCYSLYSVVFFYNDNIDVVVANDDAAVVVSFGRQYTCSIAATNVITFISVCPEECHLAGYLNEQVVMLLRKNNNYELLYNCSSSSCLSCSLNTGAPVGQCITITSNLFELFTKDVLPNTFHIKYPVKSKTLYLVLAITLPFLVVSIAIILLVFRKRIWNYKYKTAWNHGKQVCHNQLVKIPGKVKNLKIKLINFCSTQAQRIATVLKCIGSFIGSMFRCVIVYIQNQRKPSILPLSIDTGGCLFALTVSAVVFGLWEISNPFTNYVMPIIQKIGISGSIICETDKGKQMFRLWEGIVKSGIISALLSNIILVCITVFLNAQTFTIIILFIEFCTGFLIIYIPPMFINFKDVIAFNSTVNNTLPGFVIDFLEPKIKQAFMGISIASLANWNLFWLQGLLGGCMSASILFWIVSTYSKIRKTVFLIIGIVVPVIIVVPLASLISIIFLYQSFGVDVFWLTVWLLWWASSVIMLIIIIISYVHRKIDANINNSTQSWLVLLFYVIVHVIVLAYASYRESDLTTTNVMFSIGMWLMPMGTILPLLFILLEKKSLPDTALGEDQRSLIEHENDDDDQAEGHADVHRNNENGTIDSQPVVKYTAFSNNSSELDNTEQTCFCALDLRDALFVVGGFCMTVCLFMTLNDYSHNSVIDYLLHLLKEGNASLQWPKNGTAFDAAINLYDKSRWDQLMSNFASLAALAVAVLLCFVRFKHSLAVSKIFGYLSVIALFSGLVIVSSPNYLDSMHIERYLPNCTEQCNKAFTQSVKTTIGLVCAMIFTGKVSVLAFTFPPALARATGLLFSKWKSTRERGALLFMWMGAPFYSVIITIIPMLFVMQTVGDSIFLWIIACFWLGPMTVSFCALLVYKQASLTNYILTLLPIVIWSLLYVSSALALVFYSVYLYDLWDAFMEMLWSIDFWALIIAELVISLAVPADFIDSCIAFCSDEGKNNKDRRALRVDNITESDEIISRPT